MLAHCRDEALIIPQVGQRTTVKPRAALGFWCGLVRCRGALSRRFQVFLVLCHAFDVAQLADEVSGVIAHLALFQANVDALLSHRQRDKRRLCLGLRQFIYDGLNLLGEFALHGTAFPGLVACLLRQVHRRTQQSLYGNPYFEVRR